MDAALNFSIKIGIYITVFTILTSFDEGNSMSEYESNLQSISVDCVKQNKQLPKGSVVRKRILANLVDSTNGASTNPDFRWLHMLYRCVSRLMLQLPLNGEKLRILGVVEGYMTLLNTDMKRELAQYGIILTIIVRDYSKWIYR